MLSIFDATVGSGAAIISMSEDSGDMAWLITFSLDTAAVVSYEMTIGSTTKTHTFKDGAAVTVGAANGPFEMHPVPGATYVFKHGDAGNVKVDFTMQKTRIPK